MENENVQVSLNVYDEHTARLQAAYKGHEEYYRLRNPPPEKTAVRRDYVSLMIVIALFIVMLSSITVSGSRTIQAFGIGFIGYVAFAMIEGGIIAYAFFRARRNVSTERLNKTLRWATFGLILTFVVGLAANMESDLAAHGIIVDAGLGVIIRLLVGVSAPTLAFISSDVLAIELMATSVRQREADLKFDEAMREWRDGLNRSWNYAQANWGVSKIVVEKQVVQALSNGNSNGMERNGMTSIPKSGHSKTSDAWNIAMKYFEDNRDNPDKLSRPVPEIVAEIGVQKSTVYAVRKEFQKTVPNGNGGE